MKRTVLALLVLAAVLFWFLRPAPTTRNEPVGPAVPAPATTQDHPEPVSQAVLPAPATPLRESFATLDKAARAGRPEAACRLAVELLACKVAALMTLSREPLDARLRRIDAYPISEESRRLQRDAVREDDANAQAASAHCAGADVATASPMRYLAIAGRAGHAPSQIYYLSHDALTAGALLNDPALAAEWRASAPLFFRQRLEAGDSHLLELWAAAVALPEDSPLGVVLPSTWRRPGVVRALTELVDAQSPPPQVPRQRPRLPVADAEERAEAQRLFDAYFRNAAAPGEGLGAAIASYEIGESAQKACADLAPD